MILTAHPSMILASTPHPPMHCPQMVGTHLSTPGGFRFSATGNWDHFQKPPPRAMAAPAPAPIFMKSLRLSFISEPYRVRVRFPCPDMRHVTRSRTVTHGKLNNHWLLCSWYGNSCTNSSSCSPMPWRAVARFQRYFHGRSDTVASLKPHADDEKRRHDRVLRTFVSKEFPVPFFDIA
jgi:hypothetical protein